MTHETNARFVRNYLLCALFASLILVPFQYEAIFEQFLVPHDALVTSGRVRSFSELAVYSSRPWDYIVPSIDNPLFGSFFQTFVRSHLHGSNVFEQTLYLGLVPLGFLFVGMAMLATRQLESTRRLLFAFFVLGAGLTLFLSLPPIVAGGVPSISYFAYELAPMFRVYARFGILVSFFIACAAAVVISSLHARMRRSAYYGMLAVVFPVLALEYWSVPPYYALPVDRAPEVYRWLARQQGDFIVAEYPMIQSDEASAYTYLFWQRVHGKRLVNGANRSDRRGWAFFEQVRDLGAGDAPDRLREAGVKYVVVHREMYAEGPIPEPLKRYYEPERAGLKETNGRAPLIPPLLQQVASFGPDTVYMIGNPVARDVVKD